MIFQLIKGEVGGVLGRSHPLRRYPRLSRGVVAITERAYVRLPVVMDNRSFLFPAEIGRQFHYFDRTMDASGVIIEPVRFHCLRLGIKRLPESRTAVLHEDTEAASLSESDLRALKEQIKAIVSNLVGEPEELLNVLAQLSLFDLSRPADDQLAEQLVMMMDKNSGRPASVCLAAALLHGRIEKGDLAVQFGVKTTLNSQTARSARPSGTIEANVSLPGRQLQLAKKFPFTGKEGSREQATLDQEMFFRDLPYVLADDPLFAAAVDLGHYQG